MSHEIVVIDNASTDGTVDQLARYPEVRLIRNAENRGFPAAVNQGLVAATGEHILLLNNDAVVTNGWLERMLEVAASDKNIGVVGPMSNSISGAQFDREARYSTIEAMHAYAGEMSRARSGQVQVVPRVAFFCTLITRQVIQALGGVDERFSPGNYEDDDYCLRANIAGYRSVIAKDVFIHHYGSKSFLADGEERYKNRLEANRAIFVQKWGGTPEELWTLQKRPTKRDVNIPLRESAFLLWFDRARSAVEDGSFGTAFTCMAEAINHYHDIDGMASMARFDEVLSLGASIASKAGERDTAFRWYREAMGVAPRSTKAMVGLAQLHLSEGHTAEAEQLYRRVLEIDPGSEPAKRALASIQPQPEPGIDQRLADAQRSFAECRYQEAIDGLSSIDDAIGALSDGAHRTELRSAIENFRGVCYLSLHALDAAKNHFERSLQFHPDSSRACAGLGEVFFLSRHFEASKTMFEWAVKNDPDSEAAREGLAQTNVALGFDREHNALLLETLTATQVR